MNKAVGISLATVLAMTVCITGSNAQVGAPGAPPGGGAAGAFPGDGAPATGPGGGYPGGGAGTTRGSALYNSSPQTLDEVRAMSRRESNRAVSSRGIDAVVRKYEAKYAGVEGGPMVDLMSGAAGPPGAMPPRMMPRTPRDRLFAIILELKSRLKSSKDRGKTEKQLKEALKDYFILDMQHRVRELDEIKAKIAQTEANLQKRLESQAESVDLQLKLMLREADGHAFFHKQ